MFEIGDHYGSSLSKAHEWHQHTTWIIKEYSPNTLVSTVVSTLDEHEVVAWQEVDFITLEGPNLANLGINKELKDAYWQYNKPLVWQFNYPGSPRFPGIVEDDALLKMRNACIYGLHPATMHGSQGTSVPGEDEYALEIQRFMATINTWADEPGNEINSNTVPPASDSSPYEYKQDSDGDGIPDYYENNIAGLDANDPSDASGDLDNDGITNLEEYREATNPLSQGGGTGDTTPPSAPTGVNAMPVSESQINLTWQAAVDAESGIMSYKVYRDGVNIGQTIATSYSDLGLAEVTTYIYEVLAVNGAGLESAKSIPISATTLADITPPTIISAGTNGEPIQVVVVFSEQVEETSATNVTNYSINNSITIYGAALGADIKTVILTTSSHSEGLIYTLTINNIHDRAHIPNAIVPNTTVNYSFVAQLVITNLTVASGEIYEIVDNGLQNGALAYNDRTYTYNGVPVWLEGATYIKTRNDDKFSQGDQFLSFEVNQDVTVYIAHDDNYQTKPDWLTGFVDTGENLLISSAFSIFQKTFQTGMVILGGNVRPAGAEDNSMYTVIFIGQGASPPSDTTPPSPPQGVRIK